VVFHFRNTFPALKGLVFIASKLSKDKHFPFTIHPASFFQLFNTKEMIHIPNHNML